MSLHLNIWTLLITAIPLGVAAWVDLHSRRLPNYLLLLALVLGIVSQILQVFMMKGFTFEYLQDDFGVVGIQMLWKAIFTFLVAGALLGFHYLVRGKFGMGDVKMASLCAWFLTPIFWFVMMLVACVLAIARIIVGLIRTRTNGFEHSQIGIAFGPYLFVAFCISGIASIIVMPA